jgi:hypothetical protein
MCFTLYVVTERAHESHSLCLFYSPTHLFDLLAECIKSARRKQGKSILRATTLVKKRDIVKKTRRQTHERQLSWVGLFWLHSLKRHCVLICSFGVTQSVGEKTPAMKVSRRLINILLWVWKASFALNVLVALEGKWFKYILSVFVITGNEARLSVSGRWAALMLARLRQCMVMMCFSWLVKSILFVNQRTSKF